MASSINLCTNRGTVEPVSWLCEARHTSSPEKPTGLREGAQHRFHLQKSKLSEGGSMRHLVKQVGILIWNIKGRNTDH
jgi:hypothetical protein